jgi:elongation factor Ts
MQGAGSIAAGGPEEKGTMSISASLVKELREKTGAGMMDCKKALAETDGNIEAAVTYLRKKGIASASKKAGRATREGLIGSYIHSNNKIGVLVEVACETDFVARTDDFKNLVRDLAMQVAAAAPLAVSRDDVDPTLLAKEKEVLAAQVAQLGKPPQIVEKIVEGKLQKWYSENTLLEQAFVKDPDRKIIDVVNATIAKLGENIQVRRFVRFALGETDT